MSTLAPSRPSTSGRAGTILAVVVAAAVAVSLIVWMRTRQSAGPRGGGGSPTVHDDPKTQLQRELAAAYFAKDARDRTREALAVLIERPDPDPRDLISAAIVELSTVNTDGARGYLERAEALGARSPGLDYNLARLAFYDLDFEEAARRLRSVLEQAPDDMPTHLFLGSVAEELALDRDEAPTEAEASYRAVIARGVDNGSSWYYTAVFRLANLCQRDGREDEAAALFDETELLRARGLDNVDVAQLEIGNFGKLSAPAPGGNVPAGPSALPSFEDALGVLPALGGQSGMQLADLDEDCRIDLVTWGPRGLVIALQQDGFGWSERTLVEDPVLHALAFDLGNDGVLDLLSVQADGARLLRARRGNDGPGGEPGEVEWSAWDRDLPPLAGTVRDAIGVDYDHEGDLDLLLVGDFGARLWRCDGAAAPAPQAPGAEGPASAGLFVDVGAEAGLPTAGDFHWCIAEDFDSDQDVDLLMGGPAGPFLASSLRGGRFEDRTAALAALGSFPARPVVSDFDGDARPDLAVGGRFFRGSISGDFRPVDSETPPELTPPEGARVESADLDLDGSLDLYWLAGGRLKGVQSFSFEGRAAAFDLNPKAASELVRAEFCDLDGDLSHDLVLLGRDALELRRGNQAGHAVRLDYRGQKDNRRALGAVVELRAGDVYRRIYWRGRSQLVGLGESPAVNYVRVLWPNGVLQYDLRQQAGDWACDLGADDLMQPQGLAGSCPFLYTWNGETFEFISDVLGITPLGLPMAPGMLVPPDHDEYVLVTAEQLAARDGVYELQFTEELREVTYLDRIRLDVVDHPAGTEIYPNELFCFPPFPEHVIHRVDDARAPTRAVGSDGKPWAAELAAIDGEHAAPFELPPPQMLGLASPHFLELEFDPEGLADAERLQLLMTGWFYWTDASVNMAAARDPRFEFVPPMIQVPDGSGGWRPAGPPIGFPAGKTKTMVVDVGALLDREDPRLRVFSTLRLYWDSIRLSVGGADVQLAEHSLEATSAELWRRGFSAPIVDGRENQPERFEWDVLAEFPRWNPHPGRYTRLGDVLPLLGEVDDRFVIMAAGDALTVRFDANALPPVPDGWRRDFLVYLDGWAKDRDPNTHEALYVEPLPFHGMSGYPYGPDESFPDDAEHRAWDRDWNTRDAERWIPFQAGPEILSVRQNLAR